ncbi:hypothetical protein [Streptomyces neyagawaensis]|uniref:hypothetical protein n=1 Tax=Streptomyces neyagawaensis TaxID=42238 RepID=UPI0012FF5923|nr:hypothetical protein [Streptomyces neyagawaensis]MCL6733747.1 hypothetical protein [Streptomyces neyagawaensis]MDE1683976.1 hypothetical protein [Streptomyces neyagawaensis]
MPSAHASTIPATVAAIIPATATAAFTAAHVSTVRPVISSPVGTRKLRSMHGF